MSLFQWLRYILLLLVFGGAGVTLAVWMALYIDDTGYALMAGIGITWACAIGANLLNVYLLRRDFRNGY